MSRFTSSALAFVIAISTAALASGQQDRSPSASASGDQQAISQVSQRFVEAFNAGDKEKLAGLFFSGAKLIDDAGVVHKGTTAIKDAFGRFFAKFPGATSAITNNNVYLVSPSLAIEEGERVVSTKDAQASAGARYTLVLMKHEGEWRIAFAREVEDDTVLSPHDRLQPLAWLVGDWVDEDSDAVIRISCKWSDDGNYLIMGFRAQIQGKPSLTSNQRIGWDPIARNVKSWVFDSDGGRGEATWTSIGGRWVIKSTAVLPDGTTGSATIMIERESDDRYTMKGFDRIRGDVAEPDFEVAIVRAPPAPAK